MFVWIEIEVPADNGLERVISLEQSPNFMSLFITSVSRPNFLVMSKLTHPSEANQPHKIHHKQVIDHVICPAFR